VGVGAGAEKPPGWWKGWKGDCGGVVDSKILLR